MTDREGIQELYARYVFENDGNNPEGLADCFTPGGVFWITGQGRHVGPEEIGALIVATSVNRPRHHTLNLWIKEVNDDGTAYCRAYFHLLDLATGESSAYGNYEDWPVKCADGRWRFKERRVRFEWTSEAYASQGRAQAIPLEEGASR